MKKTKLTRSLLAACSIVALTAVMYGCVHSGDGPVDSDGDGVVDADDAFPKDPAETTDTDGDGVGDNADVFPNDAMETADADGDGVGDNADAFPNDAAESADTDDDGVGDNADAFPNDAMETADADGDGVGDNADAFPNDAAESADTDDDGVGDNADVFPDDATETADADGDGVGDNADLDDDNDGVADVHDQMPNDPTETVDSDGDGVGDNADRDDDNDGTLDADDWAPKDPMVQNPPAPTQEDVTIVLALGSAEQAALRVHLKDHGDSETLTVPADGTATRAGVVFSCMSDYPCELTLTNSVGTIVASVSTQKLVDADDDPTAMAQMAPSSDTFAELNSGSTESIRDLLGDQTTTAAPDVNHLQPTELIGMGIGGPGVLDASKSGLRSDFQANGADLAGHAADSDNDANTFAIAAPGALPDLRAGTTISGAMRPDGDGIALSSDMKKAVEPLTDAGWTVESLHRDWGDTAGDGDGGFETGAIIVNNLGEGTEHPFDRKLSDRYVNSSARAMFALTIRPDGTAPGVTTLATSVDINSAADDNVQNGVTATSTQWAAMVFDSGSLVSAQSQDLNVNDGEDFTGSYFGAPGRFECLGGSAANANCALARNADDTISPADNAAGAATTEGIQSTGRWSFTPDSGAMITVPDQDWMAYGAWLTTPDNAGGDHRIGVFFNGMDPYAPAANSLTATHAAGLRGSATYTGGATGMYVDGMHSGLFTAEATLTATFDKDSTGVDVDADDYKISGRIDNFRGTDGVYLGSDTAANPNDPVAGGENDWVVILGEYDFGGTNQNGTTDMVIPATAITGSADGVTWTGGWNGMFFGPNADAAGECSRTERCGRAVLGRNNRSRD